MPEPWYRRCRRWGQTNLTEEDPLHYDTDFWREHWRRTRVQGLIVNAGGIVAYYPSRFELQYRAECLGDRDLFGEIVAAAREEGLAVLARMDSNRAAEPFYQAHPDWFAVDADGQPFRAGERYVACLNGPYYREYLPQVLGEISERYRPDGFTDNSWTGLGRRQVCRCPHCAAKFRDASRLELPAAPDWDDPAYRAWVRWSYDCRLELWDRNNAVTRELGGPDCLWLGMVNANPMRSHASFVDLRALGERTPMLMCDHQSRDGLNGFEQNAANGHLLQSVLGGDGLVPESMAMYCRGQRPFRRAAMPAHEARLWMLEGIAGGLSPWWHHVGARQEDLRQFATAEPVMRWHEANEELLHNRVPAANVGLVWSHENVDFYGRDEADTRVSLPWRGWSLALTRRRLPFRPVHAEHIEREAERLDLLVLPDLAVMSESQIEAVKAFVDGGGGVVATGRTAQLDPDGRPRAAFPLADLLGVRPTGRRHGLAGEPTSDWAADAQHTYLRLPPDVDNWHTVLGGFDGTLLVPFGGTVEEVEVSDRTIVAAYVPPFPVYPPEFSWMRQPSSNIPAVVVGRARRRSAVAYLAADLDRCVARMHLPDQAELLARVAFWALRRATPVGVDGPGYVDVQPYRQGNRWIVHLINLTGCTAWPAYAEEPIPVGPLTIRLRPPDGILPARAELRVSGEPAELIEDYGAVRLVLPRLETHELVVFE